MLNNGPNRSNQGLQVISSSDVLADLRMQGMRDNKETMSNDETASVGSSNESKLHSANQLLQVEECPDCTLQCGGCVVAALINHQRKGGDVLAALGSDSQPPKKDFTVKINPRKT